MEKQGKMKGNGRINPQYENDMKTIIDNLSNLSLYQTHTSSTLEELDRLEEEFLVNNIIHSEITYSVVTPTLTMTLVKSYFDSK